MSKFPVKKFSLFLFLVILVLLTTVKAKYFSQTGEKIQTVPVVSFTPTPVPPTPTPTLTPAQVAEIRKKRFDDLNKKYGPCRYVPILMYHHVLPGEKAKEIAAGYLNVPPEVFQKQMNYLLEKGYSVISLKEMTEGIKSNALPGKPVVLTFDDGYRDYYEYALPILKEKNFKSVVFIITQYVGGERYVSWSQLSEMAQTGLVAIGNHTLNHPYLSKISPEEEQNQILSAQSIINERLGVRAEFFAYPYGSVSETAKEILKENNFTGAVVTTNTSPQCLGLPYVLSRIRIGAVSLSVYGL